MEDHSEDNLRVSLTEAAVNFIDDRIRQAWSSQSSGSEFDFSGAVAPDDEEKEKKDAAAEKDDAAPRGTEPRFVLSFNDDDEEIKRLRARRVPASLIIGTGICRPEGS